MTIAFLKSVFGLKALSIFAALVLWGGVSSSVAAKVFPVGEFCHAATRSPAPKDSLPSEFACHGKPDGYQSGTLWLRTDLQKQPVDPHDLVLFVHTSRFDRLEVTFAYADGHIDRQDVRSGHFGAHWRAGGQIAFEAPTRDLPVTNITLRFDRQVSANLLRIRVISRAESSLQSIALSASIAAALTLLLVGAIYNTSLALAIKRQFAGWQAAWAGCLVFWGAIWSQFALFIFPDIAGAVSAQIATGLSCAAITLATFSAVTAIDRAHLPAALRQTALGLALAVGALGVPLTFMRHGPIDIMADVLGFLVIAVLISVALTLAWGWRRGSTEARTFSGAWSLPIMALGFVELFDTNAMFWGGGSQLLVLFAAAWQTLWLAAAASKTHARLRIDRDRARRAEAQAHELARRDPLTGLRNRRGFVEAVTPMLERCQSGSTPLALLVIDIDLFKRINDTFGHDAGDVVLTTIARRIGQWESDICKVGRLGGEEFAVMICEHDDAALADFAQCVRRGIAQCDHSEIIGDHDSRVTVSIGVAKFAPDSDFRSLYRLADEALYSAKRDGRDRVVLHGINYANCHLVPSEAGYPASVKPPGITESPMNSAAAP